MISPEQKELADYIKNVHLSLRCKSREIGADRAWEEHLKNEDVLSKYASSMKKLAKFWSVNNQTENDKPLCRIQWTVNYIINYFQMGVSKNELEKELRKMKMFSQKSEGFISLEELDCYESNHSFQPPFKLLDVGSCYNPFQKFDCLEVYAVDLFPATPEVKKCNFIESSVVKYEENWFQDNLTELPAEFFDVVVFSLFLEYLPSPEQRYLACLNAYECLKTNGLLLIVTPDSKHETANAAIMKSWKIAASHLGFVRTKLEKLKYLYCMAFRKSVSKKYPSLLYGLKNSEGDFEKMFIIPQDSVEYKIIKKTEREEEVEVKELFEELPCALKCREPAVRGRRLKLQEDLTPKQ